MLLSERAQCPLGDSLDPWSAWHFLDFPEGLLETSEDRKCRWVRERSVLWETHSILGSLSTRTRVRTYIGERGGQNKGQKGRFWSTMAEASCKADVWPSCALLLRLLVEELVHRASHLMHVVEMSSIRTTTGWKEDAWNQTSLDDLEPNLAVLL